MQRSPTREHYGAITALYIVTLYIEILSVVDKYINMLLSYKPIRGSSGAMHSSMYLSTIDASPDGLHILSFACQRGPSRGQLTKWILLLFIYCQDWHGQLLPILVFFTRCISTPWIFAFYGFSAVSNMDNHLKDPLRYWESFNFSIYMTLTEGVLKWSVNLLIMLLMLSKRGIRRCRRTCWTSPRELDLSISSDLLDGSPLFLSTPDHHTLVWRIFLCALSPLFYPLSKRFPEVLGRDCFDMSRGFLSLPYF